jgi:hypothetical protein
MSAPERIPALDELRESLRAAAARDIAAAAPERRRRRRRRRVTGLLAVGALAAAGAAGAAELIATGSPVRDDRAFTAGYRPGAGLPQISVVARRGGTAWAVRVFRSRNGQRCAIAGQLNGVSLGVMRGGTFHPYEPGFHGTCNRPGRPFGEPQYIGGDTLVFGVAARGARRVTVTVDGKPRTASTGRGGGFLLVYRGPIANDALKIDYDS